MRLKETLPQATALKTSRISPSEQTASNRCDFKVLAKTGRHILLWFSCVVCRSQTVVWRECWRFEERGRPTGPTSASGPGRGRKRPTHVLYLNHCWTGNHLSVRQLTTWPPRESFTVYVGVSPVEASSFGSSPVGMLLHMTAVCMSHRLHGCSALVCCLWIV